MTKPFVLIPLLSFFWALLLVLAKNSDGDLWPFLLIAFSSGISVLSLFLWKKNDQNGTSISKSAVSEVCKDLSKDVYEFRHRPIEGGFRKCSAARRSKPPERSVTIHQGHFSSDFDFGYPQKLALYCQRTASAARRLKVIIRPSATCASFVPSLFRSLAALGHSFAHSLSQHKSLLRALLTDFPSI